MKKKLKKVLFPCFLSIICGAICGRIVYSIYNEKINTNVNIKKIYLIQSGAYSTYDNMVNQKLLSNYIYYEDDDGLFKSIIAVTEDYENIEKIKNTYKEEVLITEYYSNDLELNQKLKMYDQEIKKTNDKKVIKNIVKEMLELYKDKNKTLIQIES